MKKEHHKKLTTLGLSLYLSGFFLIAFIYFDRLKFFKFIENPKHLSFIAFILLIVGFVILGFELLHFYKYTTVVKQKEELIIEGKINIINIILINYLTLFMTILCLLFKQYIAIFLFVISLLIINVSNFLLKKYYKNLRNRKQ